MILVNFLGIQSTIFLQLLIYTETNATKTYFDIIFSAVVAIVSLCKFITEKNQHKYVHGEEEKNNFWLVYKSEFSFYCYVDTE